MAVTGAEIIHETNLSASKQVEVTVWHDHIIRVNVDGVCAFRIRTTLDCEVILRNEVMQEEIIYCNAEGGS